MDILELSKHLKTTTDIVELQRSLDKLADGLYRTDTSAEEELRKSLPYDQAIIINKIAAQQGITRDNKANIQTFLQEVRKALDTLPVVQITLAVSPTTELVTLIHDWFYRTYQKYVILDIKIDPNLVAGSIISFNGKYSDNSLGKLTERYVGGSQAHE